MCADNQAPTRRTKNGSVKYMVVVTVGAALTLTSVAHAVGSPSAGGQAPSGVASPRTSTASGSCSKPAASEAVKRLGLRDASPTHPVYRVLCGAFAGAASRVMVASIYGPDNVGMVYWAAFRWSGGEWQFLMKQRQAAILIAAGPDIRETVSIYRPGDSRCCPSGGTKARTWHWDGGRFTASPWKLAPPTTAPTGSFTHGFFKTPSGNILCSYAYGKSSGNVECVVKSGLRPPLPSRGPGCTPRHVVRLNATGRVQTKGSVCPGEDAPETPHVGSGVARVLAYGKSWSGGGLQCTSAVAGLACRNRSGHGFFLSRDHWRAF
jgi:hypothetical protein